MDSIGYAPKPQGPPNMLDIQSQRTSNVRLTVVSANGLNRRDDFSSPDPIALVYLGEDLVWCTDVQMNTVEPVWNATIELFVTRDTSLAVHIWDRTKFFETGMGALGAFQSRIRIMMPNFGPGALDEVLDQDLKPITNRSSASGALILHLSCDLSSPASTRLGKLHNLGTGRAPPGWECRVAVSNGHQYWVDHNTETTTWKQPLLLPIGSQTRYQLADAYPSLYLRSPDKANAPLPMTVDFSSSTREKKYQFDDIYYDELFTRADSDNTGTISLAVARFYFQRSGLHIQTQGLIWQLADPQDTGFLTPGSFLVAMYLIGHAQQGVQPGPHLRFTPGPVPRFALLFGLTLLRSELPWRTYEAITTKGIVKVPQLTSDDVTRDAGRFERLDPSGSSLRGDRARAIFAQSGLPDETLRTVWALCDREQLGSVEMSHFILGMHLIRCLCNGTLARLGITDLSTIMAFRVAQITSELPVRTANSNPQDPHRQQALPIHQSSVDRLSPNRNISDQRREGTPASTPDYFKTSVSDSSSKAPEAQSEQQRLAKSRHEDEETIMSKRNLANTLLNMEKYAEAERLFQQVVTAQSTELGNLNQITLESKHSLASTLFRLERYEEAAIWFQQALDGRTKVLGAANVDTLNSKVMLTEALDQLGSITASPPIQDPIIRPIARPSPPAKVAEHPEIKAPQVVESIADGDESVALDELFPGPRGLQEYTDHHFDRIATYLRNSGRVRWSSAPRLYTVLRLIDQLETMDIFLGQGINDMWFPFTATSVPVAIQPSMQVKFLERQTVAFSQSKSYNLENGGQKHVYFSKDDFLPFKVIGRLGRGAHGTVDKVMSNLSHREYARKLFRKSRGLRAEDIRTFQTELNILKRLAHKHCVSLVATYSDPKYFALLMEPVGEYNLAQYYLRCELEPDKLSLMRSFFGCLASAIQYLHNSKVRHRDIKPQNIIVKGDQVYVADFGIAHSWENLTRATTTADSGKTLVYAAPEVMRVDARNTSADIWSLGCVFFEMVTVLKGKNIQDMRAYFTERNDSPCFHANLDSVELWAADLRKCASSDDNRALDWAMRMLNADQTRRPTAATIRELTVKESQACGVAFCGTCCEGFDSTEDEDEPAGNTIDDQF